MIRRTPSLVVLLLITALLAVGSTGCRNTVLSLMENQVKKSLAKEAVSRIRDTQASVDDWAIVGSQQYVKDRLAEYQEQLGMNYLIARGRIQGIEDEQQIRSHDALLRISSIS